MCEKIGFANMRKENTFKEASKYGESATYLKKHDEEVFVEIQRNQYQEP